MGGVPNILGVVTRLCSLVSTLSLCRLGSNLWRAKQRLMGKPGGTTDSDAAVSLHSCMVDSAVTLLRAPTGQHQAAEMSV